MMDRVLDSHWPGISQQRNAAVQDFIGLSDITEFLRRHLRAVTGCVAIALGLAWFYNATTYPVFTATTQILIEPKLPQLLQQQAAEVNLSLDTAQVESQIAVMQSEKIAAMVIDRLDLVDDPNFNQSHTPSIGYRFRQLTAIVSDTFGLDRAWASRIEALLPAGASATPKPLSEFERNRLTMKIFRDGLDVWRVGVSYAINISFRALDPESAAKIANATSEAFVREQIETKAEAAKEGGAWLEKRLRELRAQMNAATQEAQEFRSKHDYSVGARDIAPAAGEEQTPTLEELEVTADTYAKMYESFLQAYTSSVSQQSYPVADARVITAATGPLYPSAPRPKLVLAFGAIAGIIAGVGLAFLRHTFDWTIRSPRQIHEHLGLECVGELPPTGRRQLPRRPDEVASAPQSRFSQAVRRVQTAISLSDTVHPIRCLGVTAAMRGDMKSTFVSNLATLYAMSGLRTLVIDADLHHPELTARMLGSASFDDKRPKCMDPISVNIITAPGRLFDILPVWVVEEKNLLAPRTLQALLSDLQSYDIVIVDLPTLANGFDGLAAGSVLDGVVMAAEWGKTQIDTLRELARTVTASRITIIGVLLTNVRAAPAKRRA
jgi:uncharacterized protein involved in exopolysaccharide biosynthesis/Mrp family chromosome partitioning ATPase